MFSFSSVETKELPEDSADFKYEPTDLMEGVYI